MPFIKSFTAFIIIGTFVIFTPLKGVAQRWDFIGDKIASYGTDRDVLNVNGNDSYRQVKLKVTGAPLHIIDLDIYFDNGEKMNVPIKDHFRQGQESKVIDLPGGARKLKKIEFLYETMGFKKGKARVAVWGKH